MKNAFTGSLMKKFDEYVISNVKIPSLVLMENAARSAADIIRKKKYKEPVVLICYTGNNGADGLALYRILSCRGVDCQCFVIAPEGKGTAEFLQQYEIVKNLKLPLTHICGNASELDLKHAGLIVDAMFGIGISRDVEGIYAQVITKINQAGVPVCTLDMPSGVNSDTGAICGCAVHADFTITFGYKKTGMLFYPGKELCGKIYCTDIGYPCADKIFPVPYKYYTKKDIRSLQRTNEAGNKGDFGKVLILAGSEKYSGAALLCTKAAYSMGAGMVKVVTHEKNRRMICLGIPEALHRFYHSCKDAEKPLAEELSWADVIVAGPGLSCEEEAQTLLLSLLKSGCEKPVILDADALNLLSLHPEWMQDLRSGILLTPHLKEMERLCRIPVKELKKDPIHYAMKFAREHHCMIALKDAVTVVTDGKEAYINTSGNAGMATAGSGDVLAGFLGAVLSGGYSLQQAALGVYVHGAAGDSTAKEIGKRAMTAGDILSGVRKLKL